MKLFFSAGEPSGDLHGSNLIRALCKQSHNIQIIGFGGPRMASAGAELLFPLTNLASMGIVGLKGIIQHVRLMDDAERCLRSERPDAVVLIVPVRELPDPAWLAVVLEAWFDHEVIAEPQLPCFHPRLPRPQELRPRRRVVADVLLEKQVDRVAQPPEILAQHGTEGDLVRIAVQH